MRESALSSYLTSLSQVEEVVTPNLTSPPPTDEEDDPLEDNSGSKTQVSE